jgi:hypothetical protein
MSSASNYTKLLADSMMQTKNVMMANLFNEVFADYENKLVQLVYIKRGRYEVWQGNKRVAKSIRHRKEALAMMKLLKGNEND